MLKLKKYRSTTIRKVSAATMPTKIAAISSMVSMKRSIRLRGTLSLPFRLECGGESSRRRRILCCRGSIGCVVFLQLVPKLIYRSVRIAAGLLDVGRPGVDQRLGGLPPLGELLGRDRIDLMVGLRLNLGDAGVLELGPRSADLARPFGG